MCNIVNLADYKKKKEQDSESENPAFDLGKTVRKGEPENKESIAAYFQRQIEENKKRKEVMSKDKAKANKSVIRSHRLKN